LAFSKLTSLLVPWVDFISNHVHKHGNFLSGEDSFSFCAHTKTTTNCSLDRSSLPSRVARRYCNDQNIAVVPQGGNTGLVGGSIPVQDEVVMSLARMQEIVGLDEVSGIFTVQAGCILETANLWLNDRGFMMPYDLGAKGSCTVGGNVATNAGGLQLVRYGSLRSKVVGLEVVLADGTVLDLQSHVRKDNTGYDLKQLFIGSEGSLGVITSVILEVPIKPKVKNVMLLGVETYDAAQQVLAKARREFCGEIVSACEYWDRTCLERVMHVFPTLRDPLTRPCPFYLLIETAGSNADHDYAKLETLMEYAFGEEGDGIGVIDGILAQDEAQGQTLWAIREGIPVALKDGGGCMYKYDISLPIHALDKTVQVRHEWRCG
jgi:FAD/FMN-containing dehydrogenase